MTPSPKPNSNNPALEELRLIRQEMSELNKKLDKLTEKRPLGSWLSNQVAIGVIAAGLLIFVAIRVLIGIGSIFS